MTDEERTQTQLGTYAVEHEGRPVGVLHVEEAHQEAAGSALQAAGYTLAPARDVDGAIVYEIAADCEPGQDERPCELTAAIVMAEALCAEAGIESPETLAVIEAGRGTEAQIRQAVEASLARLPADMRPQAQALLEEAFPGGQG